MEKWARFGGRGRHPGKPDGSLPSFQIIHTNPSLYQALIQVKDMIMARHRSSLNACDSAFPTEGRQIFQNQNFAPCWDTKKKFIWLGWAIASLATVPGGTFKLKQ